MSKKQVFWVFFLLIIPLFVQGVFDHPLWNQDEGFVAEVGREMYLSGDVVVPRLAGEPFVEKPPLYYVTMVLCYRWLGVTAGAARLPSAVFGFLTILVTYAIAASFGSRRQGLIAAFVLASSSMMFRFSHWCVVDSAVCLFTALAFYFFLRAYKSESGKLLWYLGFYASFALAFMSKGIIAPVMIGVAILSLLIWDGNLREIGRMRIWAGIPLVAVIIGPWLYLLWHMGGPELFRNFAIDNNLGRFLGLVGGKYATEHPQGFFYYWSDFLGNFLPWTPVFFPSVIWAFKQARNRENPMNCFYRFMLAGFFINILMQSFSSTKRGVYILPLYPFAALVIAGWVEELLQGRTPFQWERVFLWIQAVVICVVPVGIVAAGIWFNVINVVVLGILGVAFIGSAVFVFMALRAGKLANMAKSISVQLVLTYSLFIWLVFPVISPYKHFIPFFEKLAMMAHPNDVIAVYRDLGESDIGQCCITLNRIPVLVKDMKGLGNLFRINDRRVFILVNQKDMPPLKKYIEEGRMKVVFSQCIQNPLTPKKKREMFCLSNRW